MAFHLLLCALLSFSISLKAQVSGGDEVYEFLDLPASARTAALRNAAISTPAAGIAMAELNPALLNPNQHTTLSFSHAFLPAGIQAGYVAYGHHLAKARLSTHFAMRYLSYGSFQGTDLAGNPTNEFKAKEVALTFGASKKLYEKLSLGANIKLVNSALEQYSSWGLLGDLGCFYLDTARSLSIGLVFRQFGRQLTTYAGKRSPVPYDLRLAISKRLRHLPFRFTVMYHDLNRWNILYDDPDLQDEGLPLFDEVPQEKRNFTWLDNFARHFSLSGEFLLGKQENLSLRIGYDHQLQREMKVRTYRSLAGFSLGFGLKVKRFSIDYAHGFQHLAGGYNYFTISTSLRSFSHKKAL